MKTQGVTIRFKLQSHAAVRIMDPMLPCSTVLRVRQSVYPKYIAHATQVNIDIVINNEQEYITSIDSEITVIPMEIPATSTNVRRPIVSIMPSRDRKMQIHRPCYRYFGFPHLNTRTSRQHKWMRPTFKLRMRIHIISIRDYHTFSKAVH
jgi:hypothetical protein